jgi:hypothetical protein
VQTVTYNGKGADGQWFTADDTPSANGSYWYASYDANTGKQTLLINYSGPGADGIYFTADDTMSGYGSYTYDSQGKLLVQFSATGAGADGVWETADDLGYRYAFTYDAQGRRTGYNIFSDAGLDGVWGTVDDVPYGSATNSYDAAGNTTEVTSDATGAVSAWNKSTLSNGGLTSNTVYYNAPGADNLWQTADDVKASEYLFNLPAP